MNKTKIEWVKNPDGTQGYTWNPITGCLNGCPYCYARKLANGRLKERYLANSLIAPTKVQPYDRPYNPLLDPFYPRFWADRLGQIPMLGSTKSLGIFVCDMSDLFGIGIPKSWTDRVLWGLGNYWQHRFYLLTKQPQNLIKFSPFPDNCWVGVTATDTFKIGEALGYLSKIEARVKYLSIEPLLDRILYLDSHILKDLNWLILGAQTKPYKPPDIKSVEVIVRACDKAGIPVFLKDNLEPLLLKYPYTDLLWENLAHLRQEMPKK